MPLTTHLEYRGGWRTEIDHYGKEGNLERDKDRIKDRQSVNKREREGEIDDHCYYFRLRLHLLSSFALFYRQLKLRARKGERRNATDER